jgi:NADPH-ferrihemoprotein reductase
VSLPLCFSALASFAVASHLCVLQCHPHAVHITAAVVKYETPTGRTVNGVATHFLKNLKVSEDSPATVPVYIRRSHFRLPRKLEAPVIMIGPGTGLAPFLGFLQDRSAESQKGFKTGPMVLYFGCRNRKEDYIYEQELVAFRDQHHVLSELHVAFSRESSGPKVYVQTLMAQPDHSQNIWDMLNKNGAVYICGDAKNMARSVLDELHRIVREKGAMSETAAAEFIKKLQTTSRLQQDVW